MDSQSVLAVALFALFPVSLAQAQPRYPYRPNGYGVTVVAPPAIIEAPLPPPRRSSRREDGGAQARDDGGHGGARLPQPPAACSAASRGLLSHQPRPIQPPADACSATS